MTDPRTNYARTRRGSLNRSSTTVRLGLNKMNFDGVVEWVKAFKQLDELLKDSDNDKKLSILREKFVNLEKLFLHIYPKIKETDLLLNDLLEMEGAITAVQDRPTEELLGLIETNIEK